MQTLRQLFTTTKKSNFLNPSLIKYWYRFKYFLEKSLFIFFGTLIFRVIIPYLVCVIHVSGTENQAKVDQEWRSDTTPAHVTMPTGQLCQNFDFFDSHLFLRNNNKCIIQWNVEMNVRTDSCAVWIETAWVCVWVWVCVCVCVGFVMCWCVYVWVCVCVCVGVCKCGGVCVCVCVCGFCKLCVCVCGFCNVCVCVDFCNMWLCMCGLCNVWVCVCVFCNVWVWVCVGFVMCGCVYVWVL